MGCGEDIERSWVIMVDLELNSGNKHMAKEGPTQPGPILPNLFECHKGVNSTLLLEVSLGPNSLGKEDPNFAAIAITNVGSANKAYNHYNSCLVRTLYLCL